MSRQRIAIVGSGISGLACAHFLHPWHEITLYEQDGRIGGHSNTVTLTEADREIHIDTGFMVYNEVTYPLLTRLFRDLDVATKATLMSFSVQHVADKLEFNGGSLNLLFGQRRNLLSARFWRMLSQINRFNRETVAELEQPAFPEMSLSAYVRARGYGEDFLRWYLAPMASAVWSSPPERIADFPAHTLMRFWHNHGFLGLDTQHPWRTPEGGSRRYVEKLSQPFAERIVRNSPVRSVGGEGRVTLADGSSHLFDRVVVAAHGDQARGMLEDPTPLESELLGKFHYQDNEAVLHSDASCMPRTRRCWASWNYRIDAAGAPSTHYWMNNLQGVSERRDYFVSINPSSPPDPAKVHQRLAYAHPLFDLAAIAAQRRLPELHAAGRQTGRYFCGAWQRNGFHEDGLWSAVNVCSEILERSPWP